MQEGRVGGDGDGLGVGADSEGEVGGGGFADGDGDAFAVQAGEGWGGDVDGVAAGVEVGKEVETGGGGLCGLGSALSLASEGDAGFGDGGSGLVGDAAAEGGVDLGLKDGSGEDHGEAGEAENRHGGSETGLPVRADAGRTAAGREAQDILRATGEREAR